MFYYTSLKLFLLSFYKRSMLDIFVKKLRKKKLKCLSYNNSLSCKWQSTIT